LRKSIDAILIDFYGTISAGDREAVERTCRGIVTRLRLPVAAEEFAVRWGERFFATIERCNHEAFRTLYECEVSSLGEMLLEFEVVADPHPLVEELEAYWSDPPVYADALEFLKRIDVPVCCVSNADTVPLLNAIGRHGLRLDHVVTSEQARCYKPEPQIFREALSALGVEAERVVHLGDSLHSDIGGASRLGIRTVWVRRDSRIHDIGDCQPDHTISRLSEATNLLAQE
jgi:2-haloacid dehalogenase/putative hydrolase of the HAD superfamily